MGLGSISNPIINSGPGFRSGKVLKFEGITPDTRFEVGRRYKLNYTVTKNGNPVSAVATLLTVTPANAATLSTSIIGGSRGSIYITFAAASEIRIGTRRLIPNRIPVGNHGITLTFEDIVLDSQFEVGRRYKLDYTVTKNGNPVSVRIILTEDTDAATLSTSIISGSRGTIYITFALGAPITIGARLLIRDSCSSQAPPLTDRLHPISIKPVFKKRQIAGEGNIKVNTVDRYNTVVNRNLYAAPAASNAAVRDLGWKTWQTVASDSAFTIITVRFLNGTTDQKKKVKEKAKSWQDAGNFMFNWVDGGASDIRIRFNEPGNKRQESVVGGFDHVYAREQNPNSQTMHFYTGTAGWEGSILHEFGHALGLTHEHLSPKFTELFKWAYSGDELYKNIWETYQRGDEDPDWNELEDESKKSIKAGIDKNYLNVRDMNMEASKFDPASVMTYAISPHLIELKGVAAWAAGSEPPIEYKIANETGISKKTMNCLKMTKYS